MELDSKQYEVSCVKCVGCTWSCFRNAVYFTYEIDVYIAECVAFKMRHATVFNIFTVNSVPLCTLTWFSGHTVIQNAIGKRYNCNLCLKKGNQRMNRVFKLLQSTTIISGQAHQLTSCWTDVCKAFSVFRVWIWNFINYLQTHYFVTKNFVLCKSPTWRTSFFLYFFIPIIYMFRTTKCSSSGEWIVSIRSPCLSVWKQLNGPKFSEWHIPEVVLI